MSILSFLKPRKPTTANVAKERLQIILAHERSTQGGRDFVPMLQKELLAVVAKYIPIRDDQIRVHLDRDGDTSVLEINVELADKA